MRPLALLLRIGRPSRRDWEVIGRDLMVGDPPADQLVGWMYSAGMATTRPMFDRALRDGIAAVPDAPAPLRTFFELVEAVPAWVNQESLRRAPAAYARSGIDGLYAARDVSFLGGYLASGFNKTLLRTGALEKGPARRFAETLQWALAVTGEGGIEPGGAGYQATVHVRLIHAIVRRHVGAMPDWRTDQLGLPINQTDMAATLVGALLAPPSVGMAMGVVLTPRELADIAHLTRYAGWLMGVEEHWLPADFRDGIRILYHTMGDLYNPDETGPVLAQPMANDPLTWHFNRWQSLSRRLARSQHLSIARTFVGAGGMTKLGLPVTIPWYPLIKSPINLVGSVLGVVPPIRRMQARYGRRRQEAFLTTLVGDTEAKIGESGPAQQLS